MEEPIVEVNEGKVKGFVKKSPNGVKFFGFKGIPYAKPPVGDLRFAPPSPPESWHGIRDSIKDVNICKQFDKQTLQVVGEEDCLYLNVFTPKLPDDSKLLPVMVFFHGGGFIYGNGVKSEEQGPDFIVEKDVVYVGLNYRLGILGFLALNRKEAPGNMGLKDQVQALKWIQKNISKFNGDPNNVTIFGISAGGASVEYLYLSPMAKGLFHKAIAQSGSTLLHWAFNDDIKALAAKIPKLHGKSITDDDDLYEYLKNMPIDELVKLSMTVVFEDKYKGGIHFGFVPTVENPGDWQTFIDELPFEVLQKGKFNSLPFMTGFCSHEGLLMNIFDTAYFEKLLESNDLLKCVPFDISEEQKETITRRLKQIYLKEQNRKECLKLLVDLLSDVDFIGGIAIAASYIAKKSPVYFYEFAYDGALNHLKNRFNINDQGICHGDDSGYLFKCDNLPENVSDCDKLVRDRMVELWTNFAKNGNPTPPESSSCLNTKWEQMSGASIKYLKIDSQLTMLENPIPERIKLFNDLYHQTY